MLPLALLWQPIASPQRILAAAAVLSALAVWGAARTYREHPRASVAFLLMRLSVVVALTALMFGPSELPPRQTGQRRPKLCVMVDTSESMQMADCQGQPRIEFAIDRWISERQLRELTREFDLELIAFDVQFRTLPTALLATQRSQLATGQATHLAECLGNVLSFQRAADDGSSLIVLTDGRDSEDAPLQAAAAVARSKTLPIYTVGLGGATLNDDVAILAVPMQDYLLPGEGGSILVRAFQSGLGDAATQIVLREGDETTAFPISFNGQRMVEQQLPIARDEPGQYEFTVEMETIAGESEPANNRQTVFVEVEERRMKVLLLEGRPFWDSKFLAQSLRKDERVELTQITQMSPRKRETLVTRVGRGAPGVPRSVDEWAAYDVVVLGQGIENLLDAASAAALAEFVSLRGGHVVFARGLAYDPASPQGAQVSQQLAVLEPVEWGDGTLQDVALALTPAGEVSQWFAPTKMGVDVPEAIDRLPGYRSMPNVLREKPAAIVLARGQTAAALAGEGVPALVTMNYGRGTVVGILGEGLWKWSLLAPEQQDLAGFYDSFWSNLVRWLAMGGDFQPGEQVSLRLSRTSSRRGDPLEADVVFKQSPAAGAHPTLEIVAPSGAVSEVALAELPGRQPRFRATLRPGELGIHTVTLRAPGMVPAEQQRKFNVYELNLERLHTSANPAALRALSAGSGGRFFEPHEAAEFYETLRRHRASFDVPPQPAYIWDRGIVLVLLLAWAGGEWLLRRTVGMI